MKRVAIVLASVGAVAAIVFGCGEASKPRASDGDGSYGGVLTGPCSDEGASRVCSQPFSTSDGLKHCFQGEQFCSGGVWTACMGSTAGASRIASWDPLNVGNGQLTTLALSTPTPDAGVCQADPCNPYCNAFPECGGTGAGYLYQVPTDPAAGYTALPGAMKGDTGFTCSNVALTDPCDHDHKCSAASGGNCNSFFGPGEVKSLCLLPDFTLTQPCWTGSDWSFAVCNRGAVGATSGSIKVSMHTGNPTGSKSACGFPTGPGAMAGGTATIDLSTDSLSPGDCRSYEIGDLFPTAAALGNNEARFLLINHPLDGATALECDACNNYTALDNQDNNLAANACVPASVAADAGPDSGCPVTATPGATVGSTVPLTATGIAGGFQKDLFADQSNTGKQCEHYGGPGPVDVDKSVSYLYSACQGDTHCIAGESKWYLPNDKNCHQFAPGEKWTMHECAGTDITIGLGCLIGGNLTFPICNRGNTATAPNVNILVVADPNGLGAPINGAGGAPVTNDGTGGPAVGCANGNVPLSPTGSGKTCTVNTGATGLLPGQCLSLDTTNTTQCPSGWIGGTKTIYVNADNAIAECTFDPERKDDWSIPPASGIKASTNLGRSGQLGCANNYTINPASANNCGGGATTYTTTQYVQDYTAVCTPGEHAIWSLLTWDADVPFGAQIKFQAQTAPTLIDGGGTGTYVPTPAPGTLLAWACDPTAPGCTGPSSGDPAYCLMTGPSTCPSGGPTPPCCPRDARARLEAGSSGSSQYEKLKMTITLVPTPSGTATPTLRRWDLTYNCVPYE